MFVCGAEEGVRAPGLFLGLQRCGCACWLCSPGTGQLRHGRLIHTINGDQLRLERGPVAVATTVVACSQAFLGSTCVSCCCLQAALCQDTGDLCSGASVLGSLRWRFAALPCHALIIAGLLTPAVQRTEPRTSCATIMLESFRGCYSKNRVGRCFFSLEMSVEAPSTDVVLQRWAAC